MEFGLFMMPLHPPRRSYADSYDRDMELIVLADKLGYHEAWIGEHITEMWENAPVPELLIAQALALTENIVLATGVTMLPLHHPVDTAHRIAMLDHMARGRFYWGIGVRSLPHRPAPLRHRVQLDGRCAGAGQGGAGHCAGAVGGGGRQVRVRGQVLPGTRAGDGPGAGAAAALQAIPEAAPAHRRGGLDPPPRRRCAWPGSGAGYP